MVVTVMVTAPMGFCPVWTTKLCLEDIDILVEAGCEFEDVYIGKSRRGLEVRWLEEQSRLHGQWLEARRDCWSMHKASRS